MLIVLGERKYHFAMISSVRSLSCAARMCSVSVSARGAPAFWAHARYNEIGAQEGVALRQFHFRHWILGQTDCAPAALAAEMHVLVGVMAPIAVAAQLIFHRPGAVGDGVDKLGRGKCRQ